MKRAALFLAVFIVASAVLVAQPNLGQETIPTPNKTIQYVNADTSGVQLGQPGVGITWDYSFLQQRDGTSTRYSDIESLPPNIRLLFPEAEFATVTDGTTTVYRLRDGFVELLGSVSTNALAVSSKNDPYDTRPVEIVFNQPHLDQWNMRITDFAPSDVHRTGGDLFLEYNGFGTLRLPNNTYNDVAMVTVRVTTFDTTRSQPDVVTEVNENTTYWLRPDSDERILEITEGTRVQTRNGLPLGPPTPFKSVRYFGSSVSVVDEVDASSLRLSPLPAYDRIRIEGMTGELERAELVDVTGRSIGEARILAREGAMAELALPQVSNGVYMLVLHDACAGPTCTPIVRSIIIQDR